MKRLTLGVLLLAILVGVGCAKAPPVPALPDLSIAEPLVRSTIESAHAELTNDPRSAERWGRYAMVLDVHHFVAAAQDVYTVAASLDPTEFRWPYFMGKRLAEEHPAEAAAHFEAALRIRDDYAPLHVRYGRVLDALGRREEAAAAYQRAIDLPDPNASAHAGLGRNMLDAGDSAGAREQLERAVELDPNCRLALVALAELHRQLGERGVARAYAVAAADAPLYESMADPMLYEMSLQAVSTSDVITRALMLEGSGHGDRALGALGALLRADPDNFKARLTLGQVLMRQGRYDESVEQLRTALRIEPERISAHMALADCLRIAGAVDEALPEYDTVLAADDSSGQAHSGRAACLARLGRYDEALIAFRRALELIPNDALTVRAYGLVQAWNGDHEGAIATLTGLMERDRTLPPSAVAQLLTFIARSERALGRHQRSRALLERALELAPDEPEIVRAMAVTLDELGDSREAVDFLRRAVSGRAADANVVAYLAWLLATHPVDDIRDGGAALRYMQAMLGAGHTDNPVVLEVLACAYAEVGRFSKASEAITEALRNTPTNDNDRSVRLREQQRLFQARERYRQKAPDDVPFVDN